MLGQNGGSNSRQMLLCFVPVESFVLIQAFRFPCPSTPRLALTSLTSLTSLTIQRINLSRSARLGLGQFTLEPSCIKVA